MASILLEQQAEYKSCLGMMNSAANMFDGTSIFNRSELVNTALGPGRHFNARTIEP